MTDEDYWLWKKVAATVNPIEGSSTRMLTEEELALLRRETAELDARIDEAFKNRKPRFDFAARRSATTSPPKPVVPSQPTTLDLHGMTLQEAHRATLDFIAGSGSHKKLTIITGKSGQIRQEFERWLEGIAKIHSVKPKCDGGAFTVRILKSFR